MNFKNKQAHRTLRAIESEKTGLSVNLEDTLAVIALKVKKAVSRVGNATIGVVSERPQDEEKSESEDFMDIKSDDKDGKS